VEEEERQDSEWCWEVAKFFSGGEGMYLAKQREMKAKPGSGMG